LRGHAIVRLRTKLNRQMTLTEREAVFSRVLIPEAAVLRPLFVGQINPFAPRLYDRRLLADHRRPEGLKANAATGVF